MKETLNKKSALTNSFREEASPEKLYHEIDLLKIEGQYFCFNGRHQAQRTKADDFWKNNKNPQHQIHIEPHTKYGTPKKEAYIVWLAIMKKFSDHGVPADGNLSFSKRELNRMIHNRPTLSDGGKDHKYIKEAIEQLQFTAITINFYNTESQTYKEINFALLADAVFERNDTRIINVALIIAPRIVKNLQANHFFCINYNRIVGQNPILIALYKWLYFHFSHLTANGTKKRFKFRKDYGAICVEWLGGLTQYRSTSKVKEKLGPHLDELQTIGLIKKYDIQHNKARTGFNITFYPGPAFFHDYANIYPNKSLNKHNTQQVEEKKATGDPLILIGYFKSKLYGDGDTQFATSSEKALARQILKQHSLVEAKNLVDFVLKEAPKTNFKIKTFGGIIGYITPWQKAQKNQAVQLSREAEQRKQNRIEQLKREMEIENAKAIESYLSTLPQEDLDALHQEQCDLLSQGTQFTPVIKAHARARVRAGVARYLKLPSSIEEWTKSKRP